MSSDSCLKPVLLYYPYNESMTGGPRTVLNLLDGLDRSRFAPVFATQRESPLTEAARARDNDVEVVPFPSILDVYDGRALDYSLVDKVRSLNALVHYNRRLARVGRRRGAEVYWARGVKGVLLSAGAARAQGRPLVWDIGMEKEARGPLMRVLLSIGLCAATRVIMQARVQRAGIFGQVAARLFARKFAVLYPGLDEARVAQLREAARTQEEGERETDDDPLTVLCIGTLQPRKNQLMLLRAVREVVEENHRVRLDLVGSAGGDAYLEQLERFVAKHGLGAHVRFMGWRDDVPALLARSDVLVSCSRNEGLPHVVREAMYAGVPVVATPAGGVPEAVLDGRTGVLVDHGDATALADALRRLARRPGLRRTLAAEALALARERFSQAAWTRAYNDLLEQL